jgi:membrane associated rhomboid family serine protease
MSQGSLLRRPLRYRYYNAALTLIIVNLAMFLLTSRFVAPQLLRYLALTPVLVVQDRAWWQVVTYMFLHGGTWHLLFNMLALYMFGAPLERHLGSTEFLLYYFVTGIGAGLATLAVNWYTGMGGISVVGASGAVFGLLLAFATSFPDTRILFMFFIPMRAPMAVLVFAGLELASLLGRRATGVAHMAHLAGLAVGWLYLLVRLGINPARVFFRRRW